MGMRVPPGGNSFGPLGQFGVLVPGALKPQVPMALPPQSPLDALAALDQWRVKEEDAQRHSARWTLGEGPLLVRIEPYPEPAAFEAAADTEALFSALHQWEAATQGVIHFRLLTGPYNPEEPASGADILISWDAQTTLGRDYEVGHTNRQVQGKRLTQATITLITQPLIDAHLSPKQRQQRLYTTILHETGHALGLEHSDDRRDVMYYRGWQHRALSENDIRRIRSLYELEA